LPNDFQAVDLGQSKIQNHQVGLLAGCLHDAVAPGGGFHESIALANE